MATRKIYIGEDDPVQQAVVKVLFEQRKEWEGLFFSDGLKLYRQVLIERPSLIVCDILMPSLSGLALTRLLRIQEDTEKIPIIVVSAIREKNLLERVKQAGANHFMAKPILVPKFLEAVDSCLGTHPKHDS